LGDWPENPTAGFRLHSIHFRTCVWRAAASRIKLQKETNCLDGRLGRKHLVDEGIFTYYCLKKPTQSMGWDYSISRVCRIRFCIGVILIVARTPMKILAPPSFVLDRSTD
jgi:hypothetical protein